jgi:putative ABC transport system permease protein
MRKFTIAHWELCYLEQRITDLMKDGMMREQAERTARREFGNIALVEERSREAWRAPLTENFLGDLRFSFRTMWRNPGFTTIALLSLCLGIAATTTIFSAMYGVIIAPPLSTDADRLVILWESNKARGILRSPVAPATFRDWLDTSHSFEGLQLVAPGSPVTITGSGLPERANIQYATPGLFRLLGAQPAVGRSFAKDESKAANTVLLSYGFWSGHFARNPAVIGQSITVNGTLQTVIGVLPETFHLFDRNTDLWMPIDYPDAQSQDRAFRSWLIAVGKLRSGTTLATAQREMNFLAERIARAYPETNKGWGVNVEPLQEAQFGYWTKILYLLFGIVGFVLLISCANVTNLLLGRLTTRSREFCLRACFGASKARIVRQLLAEGLFLGVAASIAGCPLAYAGIRLFRIVAPSTFPFLQSIRINLPVLLFTVAVSVLSALVTMMSPALFATRLDINGVLKSNGQTTLGRSNSGYRNALVVAEIALTLVLLSGAGLMINSVLRLLSVDPGFDAHRVTTMEMFLDGPKYFDFTPGAVHVRRNVGEFYGRLTERASAIPGVESIGVVSWLPEMGYNTGRRERNFQIVGQRQASGLDRPSAAFNSVSRDYFRTLRISLLRGRFFDSRDDASAPWVAIVNAAFVRRYFQGADPTGQQVIIDDGLSNHVRQVVGIIRDVRQDSLGEEAAPEIFVPYLQQPTTSSPDGYQNRVHMTIVVRSALEPASVVTAVRKIAAEMDSSQPIYGVRTMSEVISGSMSLHRMYANLLELISGIAVFLSIIGIYGVTSQAVAQRTNEIGLRMAVGAHMSDVLCLVFSQGGKLVVIGLVIGLALSFAFDRFLTAYLFGVKAYDLLTLTLCCTALLLAACGAIWIPARKAARIDPMAALRYE